MSERDDPIACIDVWCLTNNPPLPSSSAGERRKESIAHIFTRCFFFFIGFRYSII
jgi:hypothetical protein